MPHCRAGGKAKAAMVGLPREAAEQGGAGFVWHETCPELLLLSSPCLLGALRVSVVRLSPSAFSACSAVNPSRSVGEEEDHGADEGEADGPEEQEADPALPRGLDEEESAAGAPAAVGGDGLVEGEIELVRLADGDVDFGEELVEALGVGRAGEQAAEDAGEYAGVIPSARAVMTPLWEIPPTQKPFRIMTHLSRRRNQAIVTLTSRRYAFDVVPLCLLVAWCLLGPVLWCASQEAGGGSGAAGAGMRSQEGLPPELTIGTDVELSEQAEELQEMGEWALEHQPKKKGGAMAWLKNIFGGSNGVLNLTVDDVVENLGDLQGETVTVVGLYTADEDGGGKLYAGEGELLISLGGGVKPRGFGDVALAGVPALVVGLAEGAGDMPEPGVHATKLEVSGWLTLLRLARINEMEGEYEEAVDNYEAAGNAAHASKSLYGGFALERAARLTIAELDDTARGKKLYNHIWNQFEEHGLTMARKRLRYSARTIIEVMRWNSDIREEQGKPLFKLSNNMTPGLARLWMAKHGDQYPKFFQINTT